MDYTMMVKWIHLVILLLRIQVYEGSETTIILSASSSGVVSVCPEKQLSLVCTMNHSRVLKWNISLPEGKNISLRGIPFAGFNQSLINLTLNDTADTVAFHFTRTSEAETLPLIAELLIDRVSTNLNGSNVLCLPLNHSDPQITFAIHVLGENSFHPAEVEMDELTFQSTNFTVILSWAQEARVSYNISIDPLTELVPVTNTTWKVTGNYNIQYNVSIDATLCDNYSQRTKILIEYATCELPTRESLGTSVSIISTENRNPPVTGDNITFVCLSGELIGPKRTTCQKNGDWEPDPSGTMCKQAPPSSTCDPPLQPINGYILTNTSNNTVTFVCQNQTQSYLETIFLATCNEHGVWEPDPRDHCIIFDSESNENILNGVLLGSVLGSSFVAIIVVVASVLITVFLLKKGYKKLHRRLPDHEQNIHNLSPDENQNSTDQAETVLYADIGQSSFANRPKISIGLDYDDHVEYAQLNHNSLTVKSDEIQPASSVDDTLNLDTLLIQVKAAATPMWYKLGEALGIQKESLDRYSSRPPEESIIEMLDQWLRGGPQRRTWRDVADALRKINLQLLANDIEKIYETGLLPIEINTNDIPKDPILPKTTEFPPLMLSKNTSDSHLFSQHRPTLPARTKQNSDSRLISYQHEQHKLTGCTKDVVPLRPVQETTFSAVMLDSDHEPAPPPLPPKPSATSNSSNDVAVP